MTITTETIIEAAALLAAIGALWAVAYKIIRWIQEQGRQTQEIEDLNAELAVLSSAMLACLDGLTQLGADGKVTQARDDLQIHLNQKAHKTGGEKK